MPRRELYEFGEFTLDIPERRLLRDGVPVHLPPKTHDVLVALVREASRLVTKEELLARVWPEAFVEEGVSRRSTSRTCAGRSATRTARRRTSRPCHARAIGSWRRSRGPPWPSEWRYLRTPSARSLEALELVGHGRAAPAVGVVFRATESCRVVSRGNCPGPHLCGRSRRTGACEMRPGADAIGATAGGVHAEARAAALRALAMDDDCADAQVALGKVLLLSEWDWTGAERSFAPCARRSVRTTPRPICTTGA